MIIFGNRKYFCKLHKVKVLEACVGADVSSRFLRQKSSLFVRGETWTPAKHLWAAPLWPPYHALWNCVLVRFQYELHNRFGSIRWPFSQYWASDPKRPKIGWDGAMFMCWFQKGLYSQTETRLIGHNLSHPCLHTRMCRQLPISIVIEQYFHLNTIYKENFGKPISISP